MRSKFLTHSKCFSTRGDKNESCLMAENKVCVIYWPLAPKVNEIVSIIRWANQRSNRHKTCSVGSVCSERRRAPEKLCDDGSSLRFDDNISSVRKTKGKQQSKMRRNALTFSCLHAIIFLFSLPSSVRGPTCANLPELKLATSSIGSK